jgi:pimeloyl-ACP methyl ester carboxylesterase
MKHSETIIFLHGVGLDRHMWDGVRAALPHYEALSYDQRGHGDGQLWSDQANLQAFADDLFDFADKNGVAKFALVGFSIGVLIALKAVATRPERITRLGLVSGVHRRIIADRAGVKQRLVLARKDGPAAIIDAAIARWFPAPWAAHNRDVIAQTRTRLEANNPEQFLKCYRVFAEEGDELDDKVAAITVPTLVVTGALDTGSTVAMSVALHRDLPNSECVIFDHCAHMLPVQEPVMLAEFLDAWMQEKENFRWN